MSAPLSIADLVRRHANERPHALAYLDVADPDRRLTWLAYDRRSNAIAQSLVTRGAARGDRVAVLCPDGIDAHVAYVGCEKAAVVAVGLGARAGERERAQLLTKTGASVVLEPPFEEEASVGPTRDSLGAAEPSFLNTTSGTTGLPKIVTHNQRRWFAFVDLAIESGRLTGSDVFMSLLPAPFGFGLWTAHYAPTILGAPCVVGDRFDPDAALAAIERDRVTVLAVVPTQFMMMLSAPGFSRRDLSSLRVMYTGGEMVPYEKSREFEERTGCKILQFYGSNETGALSCTTLEDEREVRLRSAGRVIAEMHVRLFDEDGRGVSAPGGPAIPAGKGPLLSLGYYDDPDANARLYTPDGWMLMGDLVTIDTDGVLRVVGRTGDFIIRGGKNISAAQVEDECATHPAVRLCAAVALPDPLFGERVCLFAVVRDGHRFDLASLCAHLDGRGVGKELWPEMLQLVDGDLPRSSGGKVAKADLRARIASDASRVNT